MPHLDTCLEFPKGDPNGIPLAERAINEYLEVTPAKARKSGLRLLQEDVLVQHNAVVGVQRSFAETMLHRKEARGVRPPRLAASSSPGCPHLDAACVFPCSRLSQCGDGPIALPGSQTGMTAVIISPITGGKYFTHDGLLSAFRRLGTCQIGTHNLSVDHSTPFRLLLGQSMRRNGFAFLLNVLPEHLVRQRAYILRAGSAL